MRFLCLLVGLLLVTYSPAHAGHSPPKITFRIHVQTTGDGLSAQEATTIVLPPHGEQIQVRTLPEVTEHDIVDARATASGVRIILNHIGAVNLNAVTAQNQGRILVVLIDGYVVYAPIIDEQINNGQIEIPSKLSAQIVQLLEDQAQKNVQQASKT